MTILQSIIMTLIFLLLFGIAVSPLAFLVWVFKRLRSKYSVEASEEDLASEDLEEFNRLFVKANKALKRGNTKGLERGLRLLGDSLDHAGRYKSHVVKAINYLQRAYQHHDRAGSKGPFNRDLSGYGVYSWKNDLWDRDRALRNAWPHIKTVNQSLKKKGLGWKY